MARQKINPTTIAVLVGIGLLGLSLASKANKIAPILNEINDLPVKAGRSGPGWSAGKDLDLTPEAWNLLGKFAAAVAREGLGPIYVTSGRRSVAAQAAAMAEKYAQGGSAALAIYGAKDIIAELLAAPVTGWGAILQKYADEGRYISRHMSGRAFDVRTKDGSPERAARMLAIAKSVGAAEALIELKPPHLHVSA